MTLGEKAVLQIPARLAYGERGFPRLLYPGEDLILYETNEAVLHSFANRGSSEVQLISINSTSIKASV